MLKFYKLTGERVRLHGINSAQLSLKMNISNNRKQKNLTAIFEYYYDCSDNKDVRALIGRQQTEILRPDRLKNTDPLFRSSG